VALTAKVPVLDPSTPAEALAMMRDALELSERHRLPVILRPTTRVCHAVQSVEIDGRTPFELARAPGFKKDPQRWAATPAFRLKLHHELNAKLQAIEAEFEASPLNFLAGSKLEVGSSKLEVGSSKLGVIASGAAYHLVQEMLAELGALVPVLKMGTPYPLPRRKVADFVTRCERVIVVEEPDACIELQIPDRTRVSGRLDGTLPRAGELSPEIVSGILAAALQQAGIAVPPPPDDATLSAIVQSLQVTPRRPRLCPGC